MQRNRLTRGEQVERNREQLLAAAKQVFVERGFHAASLDAIADAAGFSKGVVYSQFSSKAELFLALLECRIEERATENERLASGGSGDVIAELVASGQRHAAAEPAWALLLLEFRLHAARNPALNERYARLHERTVERLAALIAGVPTASDDGRVPQATPAAKARYMLALATGLALERAVAADGLPDAALRAMTSRALGVTTNARVEKKSSTRSRTAPRAPAPSNRRKP